MITTRPAQDRGSADLGWLASRHSFSFGHYYDADHMKFGPLRVINEDWIKPAGGFATHGHSDMEIITYVIDGALAHKDTTGGGSVIRRGDVQHMSAGTGIRHSEFNGSDDEQVHLLQIWIEPDADGLTPGYDEKHFDLDSGAEGKLLLASKDGRDGALAIHQDADLYAVRLQPGATVSHDTGPRRKLWIQVVAGDLTVNGIAAAPGDGLAISEEDALTLTATTGAEALLFDMA
jgi:redox-sensitive bicupin YhaK (pirin superfamily)